MDPVVILPCRSQTDVRAWLTQNGYKSPGKSAMSNHVRRGWLVPCPTGPHKGMYEEDQLKAYIQMARIKRTDGKLDPAIEDLQRQKYQADITKAAAQARLADKKADELDQLLMPREDHERIRAAWASTVKANVLGFARLHMDEIADILGGERARVADAVQLWEDHVEDFFDRFARRGELTMPGLGDN